jgi:DNA polymerase-1
VSVAVDHLQVASAPQAPLLLAVDGNSLLHRAFHAMSGEGLRDDAGRPIWALKGLISFLASAASRLTPDGLVIGFDSPETSVRRDDYPQYKSHRVPKPDDLCDQLDMAPRLLSEAGFCVVVPDGYEADDVLATAARSARAAGYRATVMTSDRDAFALIDDNTSVLRLLNGGIEVSPVLTPEKLPSVCGVTASQYRDFAALRGDSSDNLPGVNGIGAKTAAGLLAAFASLDDAYAALDTGREAEVIEAIGAVATAKLSATKARLDVERNRRLMAMRHDLDLPPFDVMRLPMDPIPLQTVLRSRQIYLGPSLWALVGASPPAWLAERQGRWIGTELDGPDAAGLGGDPRDPIARAQTDRVMRNVAPVIPRKASRYAISEDQLSLF